MEFLKATLQHTVHPLSPIADAQAQRMDVEVLLKRGSGHGCAQGPKTLKTTFYRQPHSGMHMGLIGSLNNDDGDCHTLLTMELGWKIKRWRS